MCTLYNLTVSKKPHELLNKLSLTKDGYNYLTMYETVLTHWLLKEFNTWLRLPNLKLNLLNTNLMQIILSWPHITFILVNMSLNYILSTHFMAKYFNLTKPWQIHSQLQVHNMKMLYIVCLHCLFTLFIVLYYYNNRALTL